MNWAVLDEFKRRFHLARRAIKEQTPGSALSFTISSDEHGGASAQVRLPPGPEIGRLALLVAPFAAVGKPLYFETVYQELSDELDGVLGEAERAALESEVAAAARGPFAIHLGAESLTGSQLFDLFTDGGYFGEAKAATTQMRALNRAGFPGDLIAFSFFVYCQQVFQACSRLYVAIRALEDAKREPEPAVGEEQLRAAGPCIYCRGTEGSFSAPEHVYPESLGNTSMILPPGVVCDHCNHGLLAGLDSALLENKLIALLCVFFVPLNPKTGKFSKPARLPNLRIERSGPREIDVHVQGKKDPFQNVGSTGQFKLPEIPIDGPSIGRSIYKIALGVVAHQQGPEAALDSRYDRARSYIRGETDFNNTLLVFKHSNATPSISGEYVQADPGTLVTMSIYGLRLFFNLEESPSMAIADKPELEETFIAHPL